MVTLKESSACARHVKLDAMPRPLHCCIHRSGLATRGLDFTLTTQDHSSERCLFVLVDAYSKWLEVKTLPAASAKTTIRCLQDIFATHGLPERIVSDNSSVFASDEFRFFLKENGISHTTSLPYHPASNGRAEQVVQCFKQSMRKSSGGSL